MITLNQTLQTAQDGQTHKPIVEIISSQNTEDIPFDGQFLTNETMKEQLSNVITHSSGRLCLIYTFGDDLVYPYTPTNIFKYVYTDESRLEFNFVSLALGDSTTILTDASLCEMTNGNIGIIYRDVRGSENRLYSMIITAIGEIVSGPTLIYAYTSSSVIVYSPFVIRLVNGTYLMVYDWESGSTYQINKRTSNDFLTWSAASSITLSGLSTSKPKHHPHLIQISTAEIILSFDYRDSLSGSEELFNIYYVISGDNGATWSAATKVTNYATYDQIAKHPYIVQKETNQIHLAYTEQNNALHMDDDTLGWGTDTSPVVDVQFDSITRKLYVYCIWPSYGDKVLKAIIQVDVDSWTIDKHWDCATVPAFNALHCNTHCFMSHPLHHGERFFIPVQYFSDDITFSVLNAETDEIKLYSSVDISAYGIIANLDWTKPPGAMWNGGLARTWIDFESRRIYLFIGSSYVWNHWYQVGYVDLNQVIDEGAGGKYTFNIVLTETINRLPNTEIYTITSTGSGKFMVVPENDYVIVSLAYDYPGRLLVYSLSTGALYKEYRTATNPGFPYWGLHRICFLNNKIYGAFYYETRWGEQDKRGLCEIDLASDVITYHRPSYATKDAYYLQDMEVTPDGRIVMGTWEDGLVIYDPASDTWVRFSNTEVPGLTPDGGDWLDPIAYDPTEGLLFSGVIDYYAGWWGLVCLSENGAMNVPHYMVGTYVAGWTFSAALQLVQGLTNGDLSMTLDPIDQAIYAFWTNRKLQELSLKWDREATDFNLSPYLLRGTEITMTRKIDGTPSMLTFSLSYGYVLDPQNLWSLWSIYLTKGRLLTLRIGEKIGGVNVWQNQGKFYVKDVSITYQRPNYPSINITAEDRRTFWELHEVAATPFYESDPLNVLTDILEDYGDVAAEDIDLPVFDGAVTIYHQWVETSFTQILDDIFTRFGYFLRFDVNGKITAGKISDINDTNHIFLNKLQIVGYTPDDSFSDFINRIIVTCEGRDFIEVLFAEERIRDFQGAMGWWGQEETLICYYSDDMSRRARYPRLVVLESVSDGPFFMSDGSEEMGLIDPDEKYCIIEIHGPDLIAEFIAFTVTWIALTVL
jgi:hypothetical protein